MEVGSEDKQKVQLLKGIHDLYFDRINGDFEKSPKKEEVSVDISNGVNQELKKENKDQEVKLSGLQNQTNSLLQYAYTPSKRSFNEDGEVQQVKYNH